jgi:hypothetical protein
MNPPVRTSRTIGAEMNRTTSRALELMTALLRFRGAGRRLTTFSPLYILGTLVARRLRPPRCRQHAVAA